MPAPCEEPIVAPGGDDMKKMTEMGVAPLIAGPSFLYLGAAILLHHALFPVFAFTAAPGPALLVAGAALIALGLAVLLSSGLRVLTAFRGQRLLTDGFFAVFSNPMYAAYVLAIVPGLALVLNSWLVLTGSAVVYVLFRVLVPGEDRWLRQMFGARYEEYRRRVLVKIF
jgi:protein-S-isoprenylcysteine O-methyltransferase Ste14